MIIDCQNFLYKAAITRERQWQIQAMGEEMAVA